MSYTRLNPKRKLKYGWLQNFGKNAALTIIGSYCARVVDDLCFLSLTLCITGSNNPSTTEYNPISIAGVLNALGIDRLENLSPSVSKVIIYKKDGSFLTTGGKVGYKPTAIISSNGTTMAIGRYYTEGGSYGSWPESDTYVYAVGNIIEIETIARMPT